MGKIALAFIIFFFTGICATIFVDASWGICLWIIEYFYNPKIRWWYYQIPELRYSFLITLSILVAFACRYRKYSVNKLSNLPHAKWMLAMVVMCGLINFWAVWPEMHKQFFRSFVIIIVISTVAYKVVDTPAKLERVLWTYMFAAFYIGWIAYSEGRTYGGRLEGVGFADGMDVNAVAAATATVIPVVLYYVFYEANLFKRFISTVFLAFMLNTLIIANSRGAFLGLIVSSFYFFSRVYFSSVPNAVKKNYQFIIVALFSVGLFFYLADDLFWERMASLGEAADQLEEGTGRTFFWLKALDVARQHPLGVGVWGFQALSPQFIPQELLTTGEHGAMRAVHSTLFQSLAEYGYIGVVLLGGIVVSCFRLLWKTQRYLLETKSYQSILKLISLESAFLGYLVPALFIDRLYAHSMYFNIIFISCFCNIYMLRKMDED